MAFSQQQLDALENSIAQGVLEVRYADKIVKYKSFKEMMQVRDLIRTELNLNCPNDGITYATFCKGLR